MRRYPAFDPPEYVGWEPDPSVMEEFGATLAAEPDRARIIEALPASRHLALYAGLVRNRLHDVALKRWVKQGVLSKAWLGTGEEAVTIGAVHALEPGDNVGPMIRNAGACHEMGMPVADMLRAYLGTYDQITRGRDLHTGDPARGVIPPISMVGALVPVFTGIALAFHMQGKPNVALTWIGDGATRVWEFHEGANLAAVLRLPVIFVIQNNQVALGTALDVGVAGDLRALNEMYGAEGLGCDGNNVLDVYAAARQAAEICRRGEGPVFLEAETFRMGGHATHDEAEARQLFPRESFEHWGRRDPIGMYETWLIASGPSLAEGEPELARSLGIEVSGEEETPQHRDHRQEAVGRPPLSMRSAPGTAPGAERGNVAGTAPGTTGTVPGTAPRETRRSDTGSGEKVSSLREAARGRRVVAEENRRLLAAIEERIIVEIDAAAEEALRSRASAVPPPESAIEGVYAVPGGAAPPIPPISNVRP